MDETHGKRAQACPAGALDAGGGILRRWRPWGSVLRVALPALCWLLLAAGPAGGQEAPPQGGASGTPAAIQGIKLRKTGERLDVQFQLSAPARFEIVGNVARQVVVVKFSNTQVALPDGRRDVAFNDPYLIGISFEQVGERDTWAKLRLRSTALAYSVGAGTEGAVMVLALDPAEEPVGRTLLSVRLGPYRSGSRLVLDLNGRPDMDEAQEGAFYQVRLKATAAALPLPVRAEDARVAVESIERDGGDTLLRLRLKQPGLQVRSLVLPAPDRLVLDIRAPDAAVAGAPATAPGTLATPGRRPARREVPLEKLLEREKNPLIRANFLLAEREFRSGDFERANLLFLRVFDTIPNSVVGVRAFFRAADAQYERNLARKAANYHDVINNYQSAIRSTERLIEQNQSLGGEADLLGRAFYQIGRAYQRMGFHFESNVHFQILQERFAAAYPYTPDSFFYQGLNYLALDKPTEAVGSFSEFLVRDGDPELTGPGHFHLADAFFNLKRFVEAKTEFDKGRRLAEHYADARPLLLFHMSETYYENAEFDVARLLYRTLLDRYPEKGYTKLVGLRLGDFLRDEGKEDEALKVYRQVIENAPVEVRLRGKLRIADLMGGRPVGDDHTQALALYDEIIKEGEGNPVAQEALLRKALVRTLHGMRQEAIDTFEKLATDYPKSPFNRDNLVRANIEDNLKALVDREFIAERFWEVAKLYTRYRDQYFRRFPFPYTVFQVGIAYQRLGLYDEARGLYDEVLGAQPGALATLVELQRAVARFERDDLGQAEELLLKFIQDHKADVYSTDARLLLGKVYASGRRYEDAVNAYRILVLDFERSQDPVLGESIAEVYFELGQVYKELGRKKDALDTFQAAVANFHHPIQGPDVPDFIPRSQFLIGDMLYDLGLDQEALTAYEKAIGMYGDHERAPWARYQMGLVYRRQGDDGKALGEFNTLVELAKARPGELWESLARQNQRDLAAKLDYQNYLKQ